MQENNYEYRELIYSRENKVQVWKAFLTAKGIEVVIKILYFNKLEEANLIYKEVFSLMRFKDIKQVATVYDCQISQNDTQYCIYIVMDYYPNGDLKKLALAKQSFTEYELMFYLKSLVDTLATLQERDIAHRDIKPENIFVDNQGNLIIGDLGCATDGFNDDKASIAGTPLYLSPILAASFRSFLNGNRFQLNHNVFKSDVYSLGLTMLYLLFPNNLQEIVMGPGKDVKSFLEKHSYREYYPNFFYIIGRMLEVDEQNRPDFKQLSEFLFCPEADSKCRVCKAFLGREYYDCGSVYLCSNCYNSILSKGFYYSKKERITTDNCLKCTFHHFDTPCLSHLTRGYESICYCFYCNQQQVCRSFWVNCANCNLIYCIFCGKNNVSHQECVLVLRARGKVNWLSPSS